MGAGGNVSNAHLDGGSEHVYAGGLLQNVDFGGSDGAALVLDTPAGLTGSIANFGADDTIDFRNTVVSSVDVDGANNLTVTTDGGQSYSWALLAQYSASSFVLASDGNGGTVLNYTPPQQSRSRPLIKAEKTRRPGIGFHSRCPFKLTSSALSHRSCANPCEGPCGF